MKNILITGSSGFIAPHIIEAGIRDNFNVTGIDLNDPNKEDIIKGCEYIKKDVRDLTVQELSKFDYIIHLAWVTNIPYTIANPVSSTDNNITMTTILMNNATQAKIKKFIFSSTASLYGNNPLPWKEDMKSDAIEPYSWQKLSCENLCKMWSVRYELNTGVLRLFQVYGENQRKDTALSAFVKAKINKQPITLTETTAQSAFRTGRRDFIYVKDVANAFLAALRSEKVSKGEIINVGTGIMTTMEDIAKTIGGEIKFIAKRSFEVEAHQADLSNGKKLIEWQPKVKVLDWLKNFIENQTNRGPK